MQRALAALLLVAVLAACAPALTPTIQRDGDTERVIVTVTANQDGYATTTTILGATTSDERCRVIDDASWCLLGDTPSGSVTTVEVFGPPGVSCTAATFLRPDHGVGSYRPFACRVTPANP